MRVAVARLIIFEGSDKAVQEQLGRSLPEGVRPGNDKVPSITIVRVPDTFLYAMVQLYSTIEHVEPMPDNRRELSEERYARTMRDAVAQDNPPGTNPPGKV